MDEATRISLKDQFNSLLVRAIEGRRGGMALMRVLEELDFYNSPASAKHHLYIKRGRSRAWQEVHIPEHPCTRENKRVLKNSASTHSR